MSKQTGRTFVVNPFASCRVTCISSVLTTQATMYMYIHGCWLMIEAKVGAVNLKHIAQEQVLLLGSH